MNNYSNNITIGNKCIIIKLNKIIKKNYYKKNYILNYFNNIYIETFKNLSNLNLLHCYIKEG